MALNLRTVIWLVWGRNPQPKPLRVERRCPPRDARYRAWIRAMPCAACGSLRQVEAAHTGSDGGMSQKAGDYSCVPLCWICHTGGRSAYHRIGRRAFERTNGIALEELVSELNQLWQRRKLCS
jgi:hypothetical protein